MPKFLSLTFTYAPGAKVNPLRINPELIEAIYPHSGETRVVMATGGSYYVIETVEQIDAMLGISVIWQCPACGSYREIDHDSIVNHCFNCGKDFPKESK